MNRRCLAVLVSGAVMALPASQASAQTVITPSDVTAMGQHFVEEYSVSPSDESIAFTFQLADASGFIPAFAPKNVWTAAHLGNKSQQITNFNGEPSVSAPAWNMDGFVGYLVHHHIGQAGSPVPGPELNVTTFDGITPSDLHVEGFSWSLEQGVLAFTARDDAQAAAHQSTGNAIYTVAINGAGLTKVLECGPALSDACDTPQWSPTENVIAYARSGDIHLINPDGSGDHVVIPSGSNPVWSPQTGLLAFQCGDDVCVASEDGAGRVNLTNGLSGLAFSEPAWAADESLLAMIARPPGSSVPGGDLYVASNGGKTLLQLTNTSNARAPQWSPILPATNDTPPITSAPAFELFYICASGTARSDSNADLCLITGLGTPSVCDATTCAGCCSQGICLSGTNAVQCGVAGNSCTTCPGGQICSSIGVCSNPTACGIANCSGCCDSSNRCQSGTTTQTCGKLGEPCARCFPGEVCSSDQAICKTQLCSAATCTGCCDASGKCQSGTSNAACGSNGFSCDACTGNAKCSVNRICETQGCGISNCATGCCDAKGVCHAGNSAASCGYSGFTCVSCGSQVCDPNSHTCGAAETCSSSNCLGCCGAADNACHAGNTRDACGASGFTCQVCAPTENCLSSAGFCN